MKNSLCLVSFSLTKFPRAIATRTHGLALVEPHLHMMPTSLFYNFVVFWKCNKKKHGLIFRWMLVKIALLWIKQKRANNNWNRFYRINTILRYRNIIKCWKYFTFNHFKSIQISKKISNEEKEMIFQHYNWKSLNTSYQRAESISHCQSHRK